MTNQSFGAELECGHVSCCQTALLRFCHGYTPWFRWQPPKGCSHSNSAAAVLLQRPQTAETSYCKSSRLLSQPPGIRRLVIGHCPGRPPSWQSAAMTASKMARGSGGGAPRIAGGLEGRSPPECRVSGGCGLCAGRSPLGLEGAHMAHMNVSGLAIPLAGFCDERFRGAHGARCAFEAGEAGPKLGFGAKGRSDFEASRPRGLRGFISTIKDVDSANPSFSLRPLVLA